MASYAEHIAQAKSNLLYLQQANAASASAFWDWQVTTCFYTAVHLINAHIAYQVNKHYRRHDAVNTSISPHSSRADCPVPQPVFVAYGLLQAMSRRSRYLISDNENDYTTDAQPTTEIHFSRAVRYLDKIMEWANTTYSCGLPKISIACSLLQSSTALTMFTIKQPDAS